MPIAKRLSLKSLVINNLRPFVRYKLLIIGVVFFIVFFATDLLGILFPPDNYDYYLGDPDANVYFTYMDQAREGRFWMCNQYAVEEHDCRLFFPLWYLTGNLGNLLNISNLASFYLIKFTIVLLFFIVFYNFCKKMFSRRDWPVFILAIFSGGFFLEYWHANIFLSILINPLNVLVLWLYLILIWLIINVLEKKLTTIKVVALGLINLSLVMFHPYQAFLLIIVYGIFILLAGFAAFKTFSKSLIIGLAGLSGAALGLIYYFSLFTSHPAYAGWLINNELPVYSFQSVLTAFGLLLPFSLIGSFLILKNISFNKIWLIIISLSIGGWVALFLPLYINNKLFLGWYLGLILTSAYALVYIIDNQLLGRWRSAWLTLIVIIIISGNVAFYSKRVLNHFILLYPNYLPHEYFLSARWLKDNSSLNDSILTLDQWGTFYISQAGLKSFVGSNQVYQLLKKTELSRWFYQNNDQDEEKRAMLKQYGLDFVLFSPFEKQAGSYDPSSKNYLEKVYDDGWARIYRVIPELL